MAKSEEAKKIAEKQTLKEEFIEFINRGSMIDLAVGVAVGGAFTAIVNSLVNDIVMPIVELIAGGVDFTSLAIRIPNFFGTGEEAVIRYGNFLQNVLHLPCLQLSHRDNSKLKTASTFLNDAVPCRLRACSLPIP